MNDDPMVYGKEYHEARRLGRTDLMKYHAERDERTGVAKRLSQVKAERAGVVQPSQFNQAPSVLDDPNGPTGWNSEQTANEFTNAHKQGYFGAITGKQSYGRD